MISYEYELKNKGLRATVDLREFSTQIEKAVRAQFSGNVVAVNVSSSQYCYSLTREATNSEKQVLGRRIAAFCKPLVTLAMKTVIYNNGASRSRQMFIAKK